MPIGDHASSLYGVLFAAAQVRLDPKRLLAQDAGLTTGMVSLVERGRSNPAWGTIKALAKALEVSIGELAKLSEKFEG